MIVTVHDDALARAFGDTAPYEWLVEASRTVTPHRAMPGRTTFRFEVEGRGYFAKLHSGVGWRELLKNLASLRLPVFDASNEVEASRRLAEAGVPTVRVAAFGTERGRAVTRRSFVVLDEVVAKGDLRARLGSVDHRTRRAHVREVATIVRTMHGAGVNHRDLYLGHFLVGPDGALTLIDLHRAACRSEVPTRWRDKDLGGLAFDAGDLGLSRTDLMRFARAYDPEGAMRWDRTLGRAARLRAERERRGERFGL